MSNLSELEQRALNAYNRKPLDAGERLQPGAVETVEHGGETYIRLTNTQGILAVYLVRTENGEYRLEGLSKWPNEIED